MACRENSSITVLLIKPEVPEIELKNKKHTDESKPKAKKPTKKAKDQDWETSQQRKNIQCLKTKIVTPWNNDTFYSENVQFLQRVGHLCTM